MKSKRSSICRLPHPITESDRDFDAKASDGRLPPSRLGVTPGLDTIAVAPLGSPRWMDLPRTAAGLAPKEQYNRDLHWSPAATLTIKDSHLSGSTAKRDPISFALPSHLFMPEVR